MEEEEEEGDFEMQLISQAMTYCFRLAENSTALHAC